jgi:D-alanyl-D-alanine carboxypeptidase/D-alanyl-D-alanine-endopeptidase (penicillin-binding protein 4)
MRRAASHSHRRAGHFALALWSAACATGRAASPASLSLAQRIDQVLEAAPYDQVQWGVLAVEAATGSVLYDRDAERKFIPASNMKLAVSAAALERWGPDHRFETALLAVGQLDPATGTLLGNLALPGSGDPTLSARFWGSDTAPLLALADSLRAAGVREVSGQLVIDASTWDSTSAVASWMVEDLADAATGGAFVLAEGRTTVVVEGTQAGQRARVTWVPLGEEGFVTSLIETVAAEPGPGAARVRVSYLPESRRLVLEGTVPAGTVDTLTFGTRDPVRQAAAALTRALEQSGIRVRGGWRVAWSPGEHLGLNCTTGILLACDAPALARLQSPALRAVVEVTLRTSHNWMAEQLVRALGAPPATGEPGAPTVVPPAGAAPAGAQLPSAGAAPARAGWTSGLEALSRYLEEQVGVDSLDLRLRDGSGLSAQNVLTPRALARLLARVSAMPWGEAFRAALAEPGERGGTLENRLAGLEGRVFAKTGSLTNVAALSGILLRTDGSTVLFSILSNGSGLPGSRVQAAIDQVVRILAESP